MNNVKGTIAEGPVGLNLDMVRGDETPVEIITLAYGMDQNLSDFYRTVPRSWRTQEF